MIELKKGEPGKGMFGAELGWEVGGPLDRATNGQLAGFVLCWAFTVFGIVGLVYSGHPFWALVLLLAAPHIEDAKELDAAADRAEMIGRLVESGKREARLCRIIQRWSKKARILHRENRELNASLARYIRQADNDIERLRELEVLRDLAAHQANRQVHPLTCGNRDNHPVRHGDKGVLYPALDPDGEVVLLCPDCDYQQRQFGGVPLAPEPINLNPTGPE